MKQIYTLLLSSVLGAGCSPATAKMPTSPELINITSLGDLAKETYLKVSALPDKIFPTSSEDSLTAVNYGKFVWLVRADNEQGLQYLTKHKLLPLAVDITDINLDGRVDSALQCFIYSNDEGVEGLHCREYDLETAQVLYEKMLKDTPIAMSGKKVTADQEFSTAYAASLPEKIRRVLSEAEQKAGEVKK